MTEPKTADSGQVEADAAEDMPVPQLSPTSDDKQTSPDTGSLDFEALAEKLFPHFENKIGDVAERRAKSLQDRRFSNIEKGLEDVGDIQGIIGQFRKLTEEGKLSADEAQYRLGIEAQLSQLLQPQQPGTQVTPSIPGSVPDVTGFQKQILDDAGIPRDDPAFKEFVANFEGTAEKYMEQLPMWTIKRLAGKPTPSAAAVLPAGGGSPVTVGGPLASKSLDELGIMLTEMTINPSAHPKADMEAIVAEMNRKSPMTKL